MLDFRLVEQVLAILRQRGTRRRSMIPPQCCVDRQLAADLRDQFLLVASDALSVIFWNRLNIADTRL